MPRYRFNVDNGTGFIEDEEGRELPDLDVVRAEALKGIRSILAEDVLSGQIDLTGRLEVVDDAGTVLLTVPFGDAVAVKSAPPG